MLSAMMGANGLGLPHALVAGANVLGIEVPSGNWMFTGYAGYLPSWDVASVLAVSMLIAFLSPNAVEIMQKQDPVLPSKAILPGRKRWQPLWSPQSWVWTVFLATLVSICVIRLSRPSEFLYWRF